MLDKKRILIYLAVAFGISWATALIIFLTGGIEKSPQIIPGTKLTLAFALVATIYMMAPSFAHIITRLATREGWKDVWLRPNFKRGWPYWLAGWVVPAVMTIVGSIVFFLLFPQYFDPALKTLTGLLEESGQGNVNPWLVVVLNTVQAVLISPVVNGLFTFGEEFGWRAYLQPKLMPLGGRKTMLWMGVIWGVWHWPVIAMGHNYGLDYPGAPWLGLLAMVWFTLLVGVFLGWITLRSGSVWPAVIGHAALNGVSGLPILLMQGKPLSLIGPTAVGVVGSVGWVLLALYLFITPRALRAVDQSAPVPGGQQIEAA